MNEIKIKELREKLGLSQEALAEMVGVHPRTIQNWESGGKIPKSKHAILCKLIPREHTVFGGQHSFLGDTINGDKIVEEARKVEVEEEVLTEAPTGAADSSRLFAMLEHSQKQLDAKQKSLDALIDQQARLITIIENLSNPTKQ